MSAKRNGSSGLSTVGLTLALLVVCAAFSVVAINLIVVPFFNAASQPTMNPGSVPQIAKATATVDFEQGPPPPGTPTGEISTPLPTLSKEELHKAPTAAYPPDVPTLEPTKEIDSIVPTFEPVIGTAPSDEWVTYTEPTYGFSFQYPSNWYIEAPEKSMKAVDYGVGLIITNYRDVPTKNDDKTADQLKIDIDAGRSLSDSTPDLDAWAAQLLDRQKIGPESNFSATPIEKTEIDGVPAVRWTQTAEMIPQGNIIVGLVKENKLYVISAYPATSKYISTFDQIIASLRLP